MALTCRSCCKSKSSKLEKDGNPGTSGCNFCYTPLQLQTHRLTERAPPRVRCFSRVHATRVPLRFRTPQRRSPALYGVWMNLWHTLLFIDGRVQTSHVSLCRGSSGTGSRKAIWDAFDCRDECCIPFPLYIMASAVMKSRSSITSAVYPRSTLCDS